MEMPSLFGKVKEGEQPTQPPVEQPQSQQPAPPPPTEPPQQAQTPPPTTDLPHEVEGEDDSESLKRVFMEFNAAMPYFADDDLGIIFGRVLQEMVDRQLETSDTVGSIVRRLRRVEAILTHSAAGELSGTKHAVHIANGFIYCDCGGLKVPLAVPQDDKFIWDQKPRPSSQPADEEDEEDDEDDEGGE